MRAPGVPGNEQARLEALVRHQILDTASEASFDALTELVRHVLDTPIALISLVDEHRQWFKSRQGLEVTETPREISFCGHAVASGLPLVVPDATLDERFADNPLVTGYPNIRCYAGMPLVTEDGYTLGTLCVIDQRPRELSARQLMMLRLLADLATEQLTIRLKARSVQGALEEVAEVGQRLSGILDSADYSIIETAADGTIRTFNRAAERMLGYTAEEVVGRATPEIIHDRGEVVARAEELTRQLGVPIQPGFETFVALARRGEVDEGEWTYVRKDGSRFPARLSVTARYDASGRIVGFQGIANDISAQKAAENRLRESEALLRAVFASMAEGVVVQDAQGRIVDANQSAAQFLGFAREDLLGQTTIDPLWKNSYEDGEPYPDEELPSLVALQTGRPQTDVRMWVQKQNGPRRLISVNARRLQAGGPDAPPGGVVATFRDITERRQAELERVRSLDELRRSQEHFEQILTELSVGCMVVDPAGRVTFISRSCSYLGRPDPAELVGLPLDQVLRCAPASRSALHEMLTRPPTARARVELTLHDHSDMAHRISVEIRDDPRDTRRRILFLADVTELRELEGRLTEQRKGAMIGDSPPMLALYDRIARVAAGDWTVLIEGPTGSGKELVARAIHRASARRDGPYVAVNCAGLSEGLLTSQLFGHARGAFTGASSDRLGYFEAANGGTIFLDEIGDVSPTVQVALLRVLQEREIVRVGETRPRRVDVRVLAATHRDLKTLVKQGEFREDLYYRIRVARVLVPTLRERIQDIPLLVASFLASERLSSGKLVSTISPEAMAAMELWAWPGNVRELKAAVLHAVISCKGSRIELEDLPPELRDGPQASAAPPEALPEARRSATPPRAIEERDRILEALRRSGGSRTRAAVLLGISRATFYRRLTELGLDLEGREEAGARR